MANPTDYTTTQVGVVGTITASDLNTLNTQGSPSGGSSAAKADLVGAIFNVVPPALSNGQQVALQVDSSGNLKVTSPAVQPVSGTVAVSNFPASTAVSNFPASQPVTGTFFQATQPVSASALPLPSNAAQEAGGHLASIDAKLTNPLPVSGSVSVSNFPATQPVTGTVTANQGAGGSSAWKTDGSAVTQPVSAVSLPLPAGASQEHVTAGSPQAVRLTDGTSFYKATTPADTQPVSVSNFPATQAVTQSGVWTTGRTWTTASGTDSVAAVQSGTWTVVQGTAAAIGGAWPVKLTDGTDTLEITGATGMPSNVTAVPVEPRNPTVSAVSRVSVTTGGQTVFAANSNRVSVILCNEGAATVYIKYGTSPSTTTYTFPLGTLEKYAMTRGEWAGAITVITSVGTATLQATEITL